MRSANCMHISSILVRTKKEQSESILHVFFSSVLALSLHFICPLRLFHFISSSIPVGFNVVVLLLASANVVASNAFVVASIMNMKSEKFLTQFEIVFIFHLASLRSLLLRNHIFHHRSCSIHSSSLFFLSIHRLS